VQLDETSNATIAAEAALAPRIEAALREDGFALQPAGVTRGATEAAMLIAVAVPSIVTLTLLVEKLRRLNLPRTYIYPAPAAGGPDIRVGGDLEPLADRQPRVQVDEGMRDGRILILWPDGRVEELPDEEVSVAALERLLKPRHSPDA
jgi:hypothetical protein